MNQQKFSWKIIAIGLGSGIINGLLGIGGGTVVIPCMVAFLGVSQHEAHGTSLAVILPTAVVSLLIYRANYAIDFGLALQIALGGIIGGYIGARIMEKIPDRLLKKIFAVFMFAAGLRMVL